MSVDTQEQQHRRTLVAENSVASSIWILVSSCTRVCMNECLIERMQAAGYGYGYVCTYSQLPGCCLLSVMDHTQHHRHKEDPQHQGREDHPYAASPLMKVCEMCDITHSQKDSRVKSTMWICIACHIEYTHNTHIQTLNIQQTT